MNLHSLLQQRHDQNKPVKVGLIGAGKFGAMFLSQVPTTPGLEVAAIADLDVDHAKQTLAQVGWTDELVDQTKFTDEANALIMMDEIDVVVEATGNPRAGLIHAAKAIDCGKHLVMVNVEADVLAGPALAKRARAAGLVYSLAYGDQPALIAEMVDWARTAGFRVTAAGKGTKYLPSYHFSTPDTIWDHYGLTAQEAQDAGMNAQMFNSFLDGTKSAIEMAAVANATGLAAPEAGLKFPPVGTGQLAQILKPKSAGGVLDQTGMVETISSLNRDGSDVPDDLRWGVYCVFEAPNDYAAQCFAQYGLQTDDTGRYAAMYKPFHLIGMELNISIASACLRQEPTGSPQEFSADVAAIAKRDLKPGDMLDGEGGYTVWGKIMPAETSLQQNALPIGLADKITLKNPVARGEIIRCDDVTLDRTDPALTLRDEMIDQHTTQHSDDKS